MKLLADENLDQSVVNRLRDTGHEVLAVADMQPGIEDEGVLQLAISCGAMLLTEDKDFGELVYRQRLIQEGVILVRLAGLSATSKAAILENLLADHGHELSGAFTVVSPGGIRIRRRTGE